MAKREWFTTDLTWKLFSVVLAVIIWVTVYKIREESVAPTSTAPTSTLVYSNLTVMVVSSSADVRDFYAAPGNVAVTVSGPQDVMAVLQANQIRAVVDVTNAVDAANARNFPVEISAPPGVTLLSVDPPKVSVIVPPSRDENKK